MTPETWKLVRDIILFIAGLAFAFHQIVIVQVENLHFLILIAGMLGLPMVLRRDEKDREDKE